jgi:NAD(P)-dependent dehydrogenase (short-subunit alcohol dehydrogenase family)
MVPDAVAALGCLDVLVNNAGISGPTAPVEEMDPDKWEQLKVRAERKRDQWKPSFSMGRDR